MKLNKSPAWWKPIWNLRKLNFLTRIKNLLISEIRKAFYGICDNDEWLIGGKGIIDIFEVSKNEGVRKVQWEIFKDIWKYQFSNRKNEEIIVGYICRYIQEKGIHSM